MLTKSSVQLQAQSGGLSHPVMNLLRLHAPAPRKAPASRAPALFDPTFFVTSKSAETPLRCRFDLGETPTRLRAGSAYTHQPSLPKSPTHAPPPSGEEHQLPGDALPPGKPVFVTTASGGVTSLEKVPPLEYQFLELVQQSLAAFPATAPLMGNGYAAFRARGSKVRGFCCPSLLFTWTQGLLAWFCLPFPLT